MRINMRVSLISERVFWVLRSSSKVTNNAVTLQAVITWWYVFFVFFYSILLQEAVRDERDVISMTATIYIFFITEAIIYSCHIIGVRKEARTKKQVVAIIENLLLIVQFFVIEIGG